MALGHAVSAWPTEGLETEGWPYEQSAMLVWSVHTEKPEHQGLEELPCLAILQAYHHTSFRGELSACLHDFTGRGQLEAHAWCFLDFVQCPLSSCLFKSVFSCCNKPKLWVQQLFSVLCVVLVKSLNTKVVLGNPCKLTLQPWDKVTSANNHPV